MKSPSARLILCIVVLGVAGVLVCRIAQLRTASPDNAASAIKSQNGGKSTTGLKGSVSGQAKAMEAALDRTSDTAVNIASLWAYGKRDNILPALDKLPSGSDTQLIYSQTFMALMELAAPPARSDVAAMALSLPPGDNRKEALQSVILGWKDFDPDGLLKWADTLTGADAALLRDVSMVVGK